MAKAFQKRVEDFTCENCGLFVTGTGYTNHCPRCLFSKHVDIKPGDRNAACGGLMEPVEVAARQGGFVLLHRCRRCGSTKRNRSAPADSLEAMLNLARRRGYAPD